MRTVLLASLRTHTRRYAAALVAVTIAVAFVVVIDALGSGARSAVAADVESSYPDTELMVGDDHGLASQDDAARTIGVAHERGDRAAVIATTWLTVDGASGSLGDSVPVGTVSLDPTLRTQQLTAGRAPATDAEVVMVDGVAGSAGIELGDRVTIGEPERTREFTVVGLVGSGSEVLGDVQVTWPALDAVTDISPDAIAYDVRGGDLDAARAALAEAVESEVRPRGEYVEARIVMMNQGVDVLAIMLLLFAAVAGFVAVLVIANTFTILFAQRSRDFALLRCVGATRRQVLRSVRVEALVLALVSGATGIAVGIGGGLGLGAVIRVVAGEESFGAVSFSTSWLVAAFVGGVVATVVAAWLPTRAAVRVSPLAALRPAEQPTARTTAGRVRLALGSVIEAAGIAVLWAAMTTESMELLMAGGMLSFLGVLLLGPVLVPAVLRLVGRVTRRSGSFRVAAANAVRNPRRSAATTASLLVGVTLATAVLTGMTSGRAAVSAEMNAEYPVDFAITGRPVATETVDRVRGIDGVDMVLALAGTRVSTESGRISVVAPTSAQRSLTHDPSVVRAGDTEILVPWAVAGSFDEGVPEQWTLRTRAGEVTLTTRLVGVQSGQAAIVSPAVLRELAPQPTTEALWLIADGGADGDELGDALVVATRGAGLDVANNLEEQQWVSLQLDVLVWAVLGLLGVGMLIALVGIANTVGLSILERSREHALLRALGLTRRGLRRMLAAEGMLLAIVAALLGTALGVVYAWFAVETVVVPVMGSGGLVVPWAQLAGVLVAAALAGLAASTLPARRGARVTPAEGLTLD